MNAFIELPRAGKKGSRTPTGQAAEALAKLKNAEPVAVRPVKSEWTPIQPGERAGRDGLADALYQNPLPTKQDQPSDPLAEMLRQSGWS